MQLLNYLSLKIKDLGSATEPMVSTLNFIRSINLQTMTTIVLWAGRVVVVVGGCCLFAHFGFMLLAQLQGQMSESPSAGPV